jgi:hypothetical protein
MIDCPGGKHISSLDSNLNFMSEITFGDGSTFRVRFGQKVFVSDAYLSSDATVRQTMLRNDITN